MRRRSAMLDTKSRGSAEGPSSASGRSSSVIDEGNSDIRSTELSIQPTTSSSPVPWNDYDDADSGPRPSDLYGKFTWKIETFSAISKRELRSNIFEVGGYKWYILVYPHGCDVCNHLSLFLCVADYDKLLPGWNHFAQFTIAVVNKDPKKSKYSDTLHRFCKKEHDWGWKKFMEVGKVLDGFTVADTLVIKAQVQVIREIIHRPVRCLDWQYRRELVRVYLTNVETICRRFVDEKREKLVKLMEETKRWASLRIFWSALDENLRHRLAAEFREVINKALVKRFFNDKEVTSTLVMDALYSGCKELESLAAGVCAGRKGGIKHNDDKNSNSSFSPVVWIEKDMFFLAGDVIELLERAATESMPLYKDDKTPQSRSKEGVSDDAGKEAIERDDKRLTELGRRTVEMFVLTHIFCNRVEVAFREAVALRRQEELIREEEAAEQAETELKAKKELVEKEKKNKKKLAKQRKKEKKEEARKTIEEEIVELEERIEDMKGDGKEVNDFINVEDVIKANNERTEVSGSIYESDTEPSSTNNEPDLVSKHNTKSNIKTPTKQNAKLNSKINSKNRKNAPAVESKPNSKSKSEPDALLSSANVPASVADTRRVGKSRTGNETSISPSQMTVNADMDADLDNARKGTTDDTCSTCSSDSLLSTHPPSSATSVDNNYNGTVNLNGELRLNGRSVSDQAERVSTVSNAAETSSPNSGLDADTIILSLKERVKWLELRLQEKEEEVLLLQQQLSLFQTSSFLSSSNPSSNNFNQNRIKNDSNLDQTIHIPNQNLYSLNDHVFKQPVASARINKHNENSSSKPPRVSSFPNRPPPALSSLPSTASSSTITSSMIAESLNSQPNPPSVSASFSPAPPARKPSISPASTTLSTSVFNTASHSVGNEFTASENINSESGNNAVKNLNGSYRGVIEGGNTTPSYRNAIVGKGRSSPSLSNPSPSSMSTIPSNSSHSSFIASASVFPPISSATIATVTQATTSSSSSFPSSSSPLYAQTLSIPAFDSMVSQTLTSIPSLSQHSASSLYSPSSSPVSSLAPSHFTGDDETASFRSNSPGLTTVETSSNTFLNEKEAANKDEDKISPWASTSMEGPTNPIMSIPPLTFGNLPSIDLTPQPSVPLTSSNSLPAINPRPVRFHSPMEASGLSEEFPHLALINDLLDEDRDVKASSLFMHASINAVGKEMHDSFGKDGRGFGNEEVSSQAGFMKGGGGERRGGNSPMWANSVNHSMADGRVESVHGNGFERRGNEGDLNQQQMRMHASQTQSPFGNLTNGYSLYNATHISH